MNEFKRLPVLVTLPPRTSRDELDTEVRQVDVDQEGDNPVLVIRDPERAVHYSKEPIRSV